MKTSLEHLPQHKREQLAAITALLRENAPVDMVILFGSYARGNWVEDLKTGYFSDFDLMLVVATAVLAHDDMLWSTMTNRARLIGGRTPVNLVAHDIKEINHEIRVGQYFFSDVVSEGILLYDSRHFMLARPKAQTPSERLALGRHNFEFWFQSASEFWRGAGYYAARGLGPHAAFLLHQAAERYFHGILLVFTGYKPRTHDILGLAEQTAPLHPALEGAMPRTEPEDNRLFELLKRAYIEARYSKSYSITADEFRILHDRVLDLADRARRACADRLATITVDGVVGELSPVPSTEDIFELPNPPNLDDPKAVEAWRGALVQLSYARGEKDGFQQGQQLGLREGEQLGRRDGLEEGLQVGREEGLQAGREEGLQVGREEGLQVGREEGLQVGREQGLREGEARAIVDVFRRRGVALTDSEASRIAACRDASTLEKWRELAWSVESADALWR